MGIGFQELMIILLIAALLFGTGRLKSIGGDLGVAIKGFKSALKDDEDEGKGAESPISAEKSAAPNPPTPPAG